MTKSTGRAATPPAVPRRRRGAVARRRPRRVQPRCPTSRSRQAWDAIHSKSPVRTNHALQSALDADSTRLLLAAGEEPADREAVVFADQRLRTAGRQDRFVASDVRGGAGGEPGYFDQAALSCSRSATSGAIASGNVGELLSMGCRLDAVLGKGGLQLAHLARILACTARTRSLVFERISRPAGPVEPCTPPRPRSLSDVARQTADRPPWRASSQILVASPQARSLRLCKMTRISNS